MVILQYVLLIQLYLVDCINTYSMIVAVVAVEAVATYSVRSILVSLISAVCTTCICSTVVAVVWMYQYNTQEVMSYSSI